MGITDKTRKMLWTRAGNRCAMCRRVLVNARTPNDDESVVGQECHIVSPARKGPRQDPAYPIDRLNAYENLIVLCAVHHKVVDDQPNQYTADELRRVKAEHEAWVERSLEADNEPVHVGWGFRRDGKGPDFLLRMATGKELSDLLIGSDALLPDHDEVSDQGEAELVGDLLQEVRDLLDIGRELEPRERVETGLYLDAMIRELEAAGFWVFAARDSLVEARSDGTRPLHLFAVVMRIVRQANSEILRIQLADACEDTGHSKLVPPTS